MALTPDIIDTLFYTGQYAKIVAAGGLEPRAIRALGEERKPLLAEVAYATGDLGRAFAIAQDQDSSGASAGTRARCEIVLGLVQKRQADWNGAVKRFQLANQYARDSGEARQIAWASLWLFRALAEGGPADGLAALLSDVRRNVTRAGDPQISAFLHDSIALMEASAGRTQEARRHIRICSALLDTNANAWVRQLSFVSEFFVDYLDCRYTDAIASLRRARELTSVVGPGLLPVIECNEGHLQAVLGEYTVAERLLTKVSRSESREFALGSLEGLARLYLSNGRLSECEEVLRRYESVASESLSSSAAFAGRRTPVTTLKLLVRKQMFVEAVARADEYLGLAAQVNDQIVCGLLTTLKAEALAGAGFVSEAARTLVSLGLSDAVASPSVQGEYFRSLGFVLRHVPSDLSDSELERSVGVWNRQGNASAVHETERLRKSSLRLDLDSVSPSTSDPAMQLAGAFAATFNVAHDKHLLARELTGIIRLLDCSPRVQILRGSETSSTKRHAYRCLDLGDDRGKPLRLACEVPDEPLKAIALTHVLRVGTAALATDKAAQSERDRAALWPADSVEERAGALFVAEEMRSVLTTAQRIATTNVPILITGETGTGKEVLARTIHGYSTRARRPLLPFNCTSTPRDMLDSQLFGHRRGSFTGATENFQGIIRAAAAGTLFLDEIGDMPLDVQPKLLRFLESGEVHPVGETHPIHVDVRVIAATNANLDALVTDGRFREDLFYRLNIVRLHIPALRERRVEIPVLANHYLQKHAKECAKGDLRLAEETMEYLVLYRWPGNVRQLANEMRRMAALCEAGAVLMPEHLSPEIAASRRTIPASERTLERHEVVVRMDQPMAAATEHLERSMLHYALERTGGRIEEAAALLGLSRKGLYLKRQRFGIEPPGAQTAIGVA